MTLGVIGWPLAGLGLFLASFFWMSHAVVVRYWLKNRKLLSLPQQMNFQLLAGMLAVGVVMEIVFTGPLRGPPRYVLATGHALGSVVVGWLAYDGVTHLSLGSSHRAVLRHARRLERGIERATRGSESENDAIKKG